MRRKLTEQEKQYAISRYKECHSIQQVNRELGLTFRSRLVKIALQKADIPILRGRRKLTPQDEKDIAARYLSGESSYKLADDYNFSVSALCTMLERNGIARRDNRVLTIEQEKELVKEYLAGKTVCEIGNMFGIDSTSVRAIMNRHGEDTRNAGHNSRIYQLNEDYFTVIDSEDKAYWLGFCYADSCVREGEHLRTALSVKDIEQLEKIRDYLESDSPIKLYDAKTPQGNLTPSCVLNIYSNVLCSQLESKGIVVGRGYFHLTERALPEHLYRHFIRGIADGDGAIDRTKKANARIRILGQYDILDWIRTVLHNQLGTRIDQTIRQRTGIMSLGYGGSKQARGIIRWLYSDTDLYLKRKLSKVQSWW